MPSSQASGDYNVPLESGVLPSTRVPSRPATSLPPHAITFTSDSHFRSRIYEWLAAIPSTTSEVPMDLDREWPTYINTSPVPSHIPAYLLAPQNPFSIPSQLLASHWPEAHPDPQDLAHSKELRQGGKQGKNLEKTHVELRQMTARFWRCCVCRRVVPSWWARRWGVRQCGSELCGHTVCGRCVEVEL